MWAKIYDIKNFLKTLRPYKIWNGILIITSYYWSRLWGKGNCWGLPVSISVEPTTYCNLRCPQCISGLRAFSRPTGSIQLNNFEKIIEQNYRHLAYLLLYFQGEPYLNPDFLDMVRKANNKKIYTATSTNGHYLSQYAEETVTSGLNRLIISIDGTDQSSYSRYRIGGDLQKVIDGTRALVAAKKKLNSRTPFIIFQFIVMRHNEHQLDDIVQLSHSLGVNDLQLKTVQVYDEEGADLIPENSKYARYFQQNGSFSIKNKLLNHCWKMWHSCVITWDGKVVPCCFDKDAGHAMGSIEKESLKEIWQSDNYQKFRSKIMASRSNVDMCTNCTEGTRVFV